MRRQDREEPLGNPIRRVPAEPLRQEMRAYCARRGIGLWRWLREEIPVSGARINGDTFTEVLADRLCAAMNTHLLIVYGDAWLLGDESTREAAAA